MTELTDGLKQVVNYFILKGEGIKTVAGGVRIKLKKKLKLKNPIIA
jgi:hypothetical protein